MKFQAILSAVSVVAVLIPTTASANGFVNARFAVDDEDVFINLTAQEELGQPRVRSDAGQVRVWFPDMGEDVRLDPATDGGAIRAVRVRPGVHQSSVVVIRLGDHRVLSSSVVRVERNANHATVRISRSALPAVTVAEPDVELSEITAADVTDVVPPEETAAADEEAEPQDIAEEEQGVVPVPLSTRERPASAGPLPAGTGSNIGLLLVLTVLLGLGYLAMKLYRGKRKAKSPLDQIEVVASRRLGAKHQIVLVRALGEDHLLSINGNQTQRIASTPSSAAATIPDSIPPGEDSVKPGVLSRLLHKPIVIDDEPPRLTPDPKPRPSSKPEERFGSELLRYAIESDRPRRVPRRRRPRTATSESVQGLVALRERLAQ